MSGIECAGYEVDSEETSIVFAPPLRVPGLMVEEAIPAATGATGAHLILVLVLLHPLQLLHPLELPPNLPLIVLVEIGRAHV